MQRRVKIEKPKGYESHRIVYDPNPKLVINLDYTLFQKSIDIAQEGEDVSVDFDGDYFYVNYDD